MMKGPKMKDDTEDDGLVPHSSQELDPILPSTSRQQQNSKNCIRCWLGLVVVTALLLLPRGSGSTSNDISSASTKTKTTPHSSTTAGSSTRSNSRAQPGLHMEEDTNTKMKYATKVVVEHPENNTDVMSVLLSRASNGTNHGDAAEAQHTLGTVYSEGLFGVEPNATAAMYWFQKAVNSESQHPNEKTNAAAAAAANYGIGLLYMKGTPVTPQNLTLAARYIEQAATHGNALAEHSLGAMYFSGQPMERNYTMAARWYEAAAAQNVSESKDSLGFLYLNGLGVEQNYTMAAKWFRRAAEDGDYEAQGYLGYLYYNGFGVTQSDERALYWFKLSADQGYKDSIDYLAKMISEGRTGAKPKRSGSRSNPNTGLRQNRGRGGP